MQVKFPFHTTKCAYIRAYPVIFDNPIAKNACKFKHIVVNCSDASMIDGKYGLTHEFLLKETIVNQKNMEKDKIMPLIKASSFLL